MAGTAMIQARVSARRPIERGQREAGEAASASEQR